MNQSMKQSMMQGMKRVLSVGLATVLSALSLAMPPVTVQAAGEGLGEIGNAVFSEVREITRGLILEHTDSRNINGPQKSYTFTYNPAQADVVPLLTSGAALYGGETLRRMAALAEEQGQNVIAGINGGFYDIANGTPLGLVVTNGELTSASAGTDGNRVVVGFRADGSLVTGVPHLTIFYQKGGENVVHIAGINNPPKAEGIHLFTDRYYTSTKTTAPGVEVVLDTAGQKLAIDGVITATVKSVQGEVTNTPIAAGEMVLYCADKGAGEAALAALAAGDQLTLRVMDVNKNGFSALQQAVAGAEYYLIKDGAIDPSLPDKGDVNSAHPRTTIGVKADGSVVLHVVDGRKKGYSGGLTDTETAQAMLALGCVTAVRLDGGGSSTAIAQLPGNPDPTLLNKPSDGTERRVSNALLLLSTKQAVNDGAKQLHAYPSKIQILGGSQYDLSSIVVKATDSNFYPATLTSGLNYSVEGDIGAIDGTIFTAKTGKNASGQIAITSGKISTKIDVEVMGTVDTLKASTPMVIAAPGSSHQITINAYIQGRKIISSPGAYQWRVNAGEIGQIDANGRFTAADKAGTGMLTASAGGKVLPVQVEVCTPIITKNTTWKVLDTGADANTFTSTVPDTIGVGVPYVPHAWTYPAGFTATRGVTTARLNMRQSAPAGAVVTIVPAGEAVEILDRQQVSEGKWWVKVNYNGRIGWCSSAYLRIGQITGGDDSRWASAAGPFGVSAAGSSFLDSAVTLNQNAKGDSIPTYFFRTTFTVEDASQIRYIAGSLAYNDAAVVYINGKKVASLNTVGYKDNLSYGAAKPVEQKQEGNFALKDTSMLVSGINTLAVEIRQKDAVSKDAYFSFNSLILSKNTP